MAVDSQNTVVFQRLKPLMMLLSGLALVGVGVLAGHLLNAGNHSNAAANPSPGSAFTQNPGTTQQLPGDAASPDLLPDGSASAAPTGADVASVGSAPATPTAIRSAATSQADSQVEVTANYIAIADEELRIGNYAKALDIYNFVLSQVSGAGEAAVRFRMALAAEAAGSFTEAIVGYQRVSRSFRESPWAAVAELGEARCLAASGQTDQLELTLVQRLILDASRFPDSIRGELLHLCGRAFAGTLVSLQQRPLVDDQCLILPAWVADPITILDDLPAMLQDVPRDVHEITFEILQGQTEAPESVYLRVHSAHASIRLLLTATLKKCGYECQFSDQALAAIDGRKQSLHADDISLSLLLDGMCIPFGMAWILQGDTVQIRSRAELTDTQRKTFQAETAERLLRTAMVQYPDSPQVGHTRVALGILLYHAQRPADALHMFRSQLELQSRSPVDAEASFNLAKCYLNLNQQDEALQTFLYCVDSTGGQPLAGTAAYLYCGRLQIAARQYQTAVSSLVRALALSQGTQLENEAALMLSSAYLLAGNPQGANEVLMKRRSELSRSPGRSAAAFLSALCRFRSAVLQDRREREGEALVSALTQFDPRQQFGIHWAVLAAEASEELGLYQQATQHYLSVLNSAPGAVLRDRTLMKLAERYRSDGRLKEAAELLSAVSEANSELFRLQVALQAAVISKEQGDPAGTVRFCRFVLTNSDDEAVRRTALKMMGRAYEQQQDYEAAVYCFAGMIPAENRSLQQPADPGSGQRGQP